jgi:hypothetical protein
VEQELPYYDPRAASAYLKKRGLRTEPQTLAKYRSAGGGPKFAYFGRFPRYREDWLEEYARSRISGPLRSTSEAASRRSDRRATDGRNSEPSARAAAIAVLTTPPPNPGVRRVRAHRPRADREPYRVTDRRLSGNACAGRGSIGRRQPCFFGGEVN